MQLIYDKQFDDNDLTKETCKTVIGYSPQDLLGLTGIYSIYKFEQLPASVIYVSGKYPNLILTIETKAITLANRINIKTRKIVILSLKTEPNKRGIGAELFCSQISIA